MRYPFVIGFGLCLSPWMPGFAWSGDTPNAAEVAGNRSDYVTRSGATVPKPDKLDARESSEIQRRTPEQLRNDAILRGICTGCTR
jgi:hypothetical protein